MLPRSETYKARREASDKLISKGNKATKPPSNFDNQQLLSDIDPINMKWFRDGDNRDFFTSPFVLDHNAALADALKSNFKRVADLCAEITKNDTFISNNSAVIEMCQEKISNIKRKPNKERDRNQLSELETRVRDLKKQSERVQKRNYRLMHELVAEKNEILKNHQALIAKQYSSDRISDYTRGVSQSTSFDEISHLQGILDNETNLFFNDVLFDVEQAYLLSGSTDAALNGFFSEVLAIQENKSLSSLEKVQHVAKALKQCKSKDAKPLLKHIESACAAREAQLESFNQFAKNNIEIKIQRQVELLQGKYSDTELIGMAGADAGKRKVWYQAQVRELAKLIQMHPDYNTDTNNELNQIVCKLNYQAADQAWNIGAQPNENIKSKVGKVKIDLHQIVKKRDKLKQLGAPKKNSGMFGLFQRAQMKVGFPKEKEKNRPGFKR